MLIDNQEGETKEEPDNSMKNQMNYSTLGRRDDNPMEGTSDDENILGVMFKMEISPDPDLSEEKVIMILYSKVKKLIYQWIKHKDIEGIYTKEHEVLVDNLEEQAFEWAIDSRVIFKKHIIVAETFVDLKTEQKVFQLYEKQKDMCKDFCVKLETMKSVEGFTRRIGFLSGPHVQTALTEFYERKLVDASPDSEGMIAIKKQATFERGIRSKVLVVYGLESEANCIDMEIVAKKYKGFKYMSYK